MKEKDPDKVTSIYRATLERVSEVGLQGLKMAEIAKRAQIASGTLYLYFSSKEELLNSLYRQLKLQQSYLKPVSQAESALPLKLQLKAIWTQALKYRMAHYAEAFFLEQFARSPALSEESKQVSDQITAHLLTLLELAKAELIIKNLPNELLFCLLLGLLKETTSLCQAKQQELDQDLIENSFLLCWDALKA